MSVRSIFYLSHAGAVARPEGGRVLKPRVVGLFRDYIAAAKIKSPNSGAGAVWLSTPLINTAASARCHAAMSDAEPFKRFRLCRPPKFTALKRRC